MITPALLGVIAGNRQSGGGTDPYFSSVKLLLHGDALTDHSSVGRTVTLGGDSIVDTSLKQYGSASFRIRTAASAGTAFDQVLTDQGNVADHSDVGSGDFTLECLIYPLALPSGNAVLWNKSIATGFYPWQVLLNSSGQIQFRGYNSTTPTPSLYFDITTTGTAIATGAWYFIQARRSGSTFAVAIDGTERATSTVGTSALWFDSGQIMLGGFTSGTASVAFRGHMEEARLTKGVARSFGTISAPFPNA